jgi:hypothetical protein
MSFGVDQNNEKLAVNLDDVFCSLAAGSRILAVVALLQRVCIADRFRCPLSFSTQRKLKKPLRGYQVSCTGTCFDTFTEYIHVPVLF